MVLTREGFFDVVEAVLTHTVMPEPFVGGQTYLPWTNVQYLMAAIRASVHNLEDPNGIATGED